MTRPRPDRSRRRAGLGVGTLFNYVKDKRDLIYLILNKDLLIVTEVSLEAPKTWANIS